MFLIFAYKGESKESVRRTKHFWQTTAFFFILLVAAIDRDSSASNLCLRRARQEMRNDRNGDFIFFQ